MPVYFVTGKLGSGKTLAMVARMRDHYLAKGLPVATNIDIDIRKLVAVRPAVMPVRLPDKPSIDDLHALGAAHTTCQEDRNGAIVLDECGTWLNSRGWSDKGRTALIDWLLHSRKLGWDVFFVIQHHGMMDKQIRDALAEYLVVCRRLDRLRIPFLGSLLRAVTFGRVTGALPKVHVATVHYGIGAGAFLSDRWYYRAHELYAAYSSAQIVTDTDAAQYSLLWYETACELGVRQRLQRKPKLPAVRRMSGLPVGEAVRIAARYCRALDRAGLSAPLPSRQGV